jgi:hypothetical protein
VTATTDEHTDTQPIYCPRGKKPTMSHSFDQSHSLCRTTSLADCGAGPTQELRLLLIRPSPLIGRNWSMCCTPRRLHDFLQHPAGSLISRHPGIELRDASDTAKPTFSCLPDSAIKGPGAEDQVTLVLVLVMSISSTTVLRICCLPSLKGGLIYSPVTSITRLFDAQNCR